MTVQTLSASVLKGPYNDESRKYPLWDFMERFASWFEAGDHDHSEMTEYYTEDFSFHTPHADRLESTATDGYGDGHVMKRATEQIYSEPLKNFWHANAILMAFESADGYDIYTHHAMFGNVAGTPSGDEEKVKDDHGREWDVEIPVSYHFDIAKDSKSKHGFKCRHITIIKDTGVINDILDARGMGHKRSINK